jgi:hypothetical protein
MYRIKDRGNRVGFIRQYRGCFLIIVSRGSSGNYRSNMPDTHFGDRLMERDLEFHRVYEQMC